MSSSAAAHCEQHTRKRAAEDEEGHRERVAHIRCFAGSRVDNRAAGRHHDCGKESEARDAP